MFHVLTPFEVTRDANQSFTFKTKFFEYHIITTKKTELQIVIDTMDINFVLFVCCLYLHILAKQQLFHCFIIHIHKDKGP